MKQQKGLGRGLDAIFGSEKVEAHSSSSDNKLSLVSIDKIAPNPSQPRRTFDEESLNELADSIRELGIIQPITLKSNGSGEYTIISGERRWRASQKADLKEIPAYIRKTDDMTMHTMALVENLQREDLNPIEIAFGLQRLIEECELTQEMLAQKLSMKRPSISNYLRLLKMSEPIQVALKRELISMGHAKAIASVESQEMQLDLLSICIEREISVREAESRAQQLNRQHEQKYEEKIELAPSPSGYESLSSHLNTIFTKGVEIKTNRRGGGKIVINFTNRSEIEQFIKELES